MPLVFAQYPPSCYFKLFEIGLCPFERAAKEILKHGYIGSMDLVSGR